MSKMFYNYDNGIAQSSPIISSHLEKFEPPLPNLSLLYDLNNKFYGVEIRRGTPCTLYFHLDELNGQNLTGLLLNCVIEFKLLNTISHKIVFQKNFSGNQAFNTFTNDLEITLNLEDLAQLKQESFDIELNIIQANKSYKLFTKGDGLFIVR